MNSKSWFNEDKTWAVSMAVYNPTTTEDVRKAVGEMTTISALEENEKQVSERKASQTGGKGHQTRSDRTIL